MRVSKSRNVCGYVKAVEKYNKLARATEAAAADVSRRFARLTGGQIGEAARILSGRGGAGDKG
jgi:hypothetical protein